MQRYPYRITAPVTESTYNELCRLSSDKDLQISAIVRDLLENALRKKRQKSKKKEGVQAAKLGTFVSEGFASTPVAAEAEATS